MNVSIFILIAVLLAFGTGFFVALIIWSIKWFLVSNSEKVEYAKSVHLLHIFSTSKSLKAYKSGSIVCNDPINLELFKFYHGKN